MSISDPQSTSTPLTADEVLPQAEAVLAAIQAAVDDAIEAHRRDGDPIVVCDDKGNVHWIPANEIEPRRPESDR